MCTYDCDNRLLKVEHDPTTGGNVTVATFAYDALGRKITAWTQFDVAGSGGDSHTSDLRFYHDGQVEIADYNSDGSLARRFVNGTQYIDERAVLIEGEAGDNGAPVDAETFYYLLQELYTVTGLMKVNGTLTEAHTFDGYGKARLWHYSDGDFNRDGAVNATDQTRFTAALGVSSGIPAADPLADLDLDGDVDLTDSYAFTQIKNGGGALAELFTAATGNPFYFTGRRLYMLETLPEGDTDPVANQQLQHNRARHYSPMEGRWLQRDPMEYVDGTNLYSYISCSPSVLQDPMGLTFVVGNRGDDGAQLGNADNNPSSPTFDPDAVCRALGAGWSLESAPSGGAQWSAWICEERMGWFGRLRTCERTVQYFRPTGDSCVAGCCQDLSCSIALLRTRIRNWTVGGSLTGSIDVGGGSVGGGVSGSVGGGTTEGETITQTFTHASHDHEHKAIVVRTFAELRGTGYGASYDLNDQDWFNNPRYRPANSDGGRPKDSQWLNEIGFVLCKKACPPKPANK